MPCLCFHSIFTSQNTSKTQQASFLEKYHMCPVDCKLPELFVACRLQVQGSKQADTRRRLSWSGQFICLQTVPTRRSGKEERMVGMTRGGRLQGCRLSSPAPGSGVMLTPSPLALSLHGRVSHGDVGRPCRKEAFMPDKLCYSKAACLSSWLLQRVLIPPKRVLRCY